MKEPSWLKCDSKSGCKVLGIKIHALASLTQVSKF